MTITTDPTLVKPQSRLNGTGISNRLVATRLSLRNRLDSHSLWTSHRGQITCLLPLEVSLGDEANGAVCSKPFSMTTTDLLDSRETPRG